MKPEKPTNRRSIQTLFHKPSIQNRQTNLVPHVKKIPMPETRNKPLRAHKIGENNGNTVLKTETESRIILIADEEITIYKRDGQPTALTICFAGIIIIQFLIILYLCAR